MIVLIGYMASGKTTIAKKMAELLQYDYLDLDVYIEGKEKNSIKNIFSEKGEIYFRKIEHQYLKEILKTKSNKILAVGGGTPCYYNNMELMNKHATTIYLNASVTTIFDRVKNQKNTRPLIKNIKNNKLIEFIAKHLFERNFFYSQAKHTVNVDAKNIGEIVLEISKL